MELKLDPQRKRELVELIVNAGLEEDLLEWLKQQGYTYFFGKLDNIPDELILTYVKIRKLLVVDEDEKFISEAVSTPELEPPEKRNYIPAKREK